eukprot:CAMPEP_0196570410 /NCGR_PEP_ID=MMETSP1081-20130531/489_1 /TAXON_ID=36882 /ORGANISM="Pyramimonas amylifera, Strain CCMP720" /LENGTH=68 /DNA_ID=CAMNT_0041886837 /DNA_START=109 /DNA_END=315 /DNA_ORIENTATION=+
MPNAIQVIRAQQKIVQEAQKAKGFVHMIGPYDKILSVYVPLTMSAMCALMVGDGMSKMYLGRGKMEGF